MTGSKWICYNIGDEDLHGRRQGCAEHVVIQSRLRRLGRHGYQVSSISRYQGTRYWYLPIPGYRYQVLAQGTRYHVLAGTRVPGTGTCQYQGTRYQGENKHGLKEVDLAWVLRELKSPYPTEGVDLAWVLRELKSPYPTESPLIEEEKERERRGEEGTIWRLNVGEENESSL
uniref:Uncharacterized protein n=1 Tax=Oryza glumipatula TaxID=40148 RepID=A0A0D9ZP01_9ORYZ